MDMEKRKRRGSVKNCRGKAGETLTETLIAMLIIGLSSVLFLTMIGASGRIFRRAETQYEKIYDKITVADGQKGADKLPDADSPGGIFVKGSEESSVIVDWYGDWDYVLSYKAK